VFVVSFLVLYPFFFIAIKTKKLEAAFFLKRVWSFCIAFGSGIIPKLMYESKSKIMPKPCVFVANHTSYLDIVLSTFYIDHLAIYMGKAELLKAPLFKTFFKGMDIPVKRTSRMDAHKAFTAAGNEIDKGRSMVIFPEGTISKQPKLMPFKNGAFKLAIEKQVPIVPIVNLNHKKLLENGGYFKSNGCCGIAKTIVLVPIHTKGLTENDVEVLKENIFNLIQNTLNKYNGK
jgi:1-acyl-sn-glycerol-3-phosphate acyltransferase